MRDASSTPPMTTAMTASSSQYLPWVLSIARFRAINSQRKQGRDKGVVWTFHDFERFGDALSNSQAVGDEAEPYHR